MRNDVKPVIPPQRPRAESVDTYEVAEGDAAFDDENASGVRRERGDATDPAGPKRSAMVGGAGTAVTDNSGTTADVSRSNDRLSTTTGKLRDRDMERSARMSAMPDTDVLPTAREATSLWVPALAAVLLIVLGLCLLWVFGVFATADPTTSGEPTLGELRRQELKQDD